MSHKLSPAKQNALLAKCTWDDAGRRVKVTCTHHTEPLLRLAGISHPRACEAYFVPAMRDGSGFLVIDTEARAESASHGELFEAGGLLAGMSPEIHTPVDCSTRVEITNDLLAGMVEETKALIHGHGRRFEVTTGPTSKIRLLIIAMDDRALPSPSERELWEPRDPTDTDVIAATHALALARELAHFER
jgi:hypothetical protein